MFNLPLPLARAIEACVEQFPGPEVEREVGQLVSRYRATTGITHHPLDSPVAAAAYAAYRMPGTYASLSAMFSQVRTTLPGLSPRSMIDVGSGTGAAAWAATGAWPGLGRVTLVETSQPVVELGKRLAAAGPPPLVDARWVSADATAPLPRADLAMAAYLLGELEPPRRRALVESMLGTAETIAFVEPGTPAGYRRILEARESLISSGWTIAAPCPHELACPLAATDWCHFVARFSRSPRLRRLKGAEHGYEDEKFSYVVGIRSEARGAAGRVIRHPQKRTGLVMLEVCAADGNATTVTISKRHGPLYRNARAARWGDAWPT